MPPEYAQSVHTLTQGDVYSFRIVLLETIIVKRPTDSMFESELSIVSYVERGFPDQMLRIVDAHLREECKHFIRATMETENEVHRCLLSRASSSFLHTFVPKRKNEHETSSH